MGVINKVRDVVDKAIDTAIAWIVAKAKALFAKLFGKDKGGKPDERTPEQKAKDVKAAIGEANPLIENTEFDLEEVTAKLKAIKTKYKLTTLEVRKDSATEGEESDFVFAEINPNDKTKVIKRHLRFVPAVSVDFVCPPEMNSLKAEYATQVKGQETGLNSLKLTDWESNVRRYAKEGRSEEGSQKQREFREAERERRINAAIKDDKLTRSQAEKRVDIELKGLAALHDPDQIAGGDPTDVNRLGSRRVNSSIGSQWRTKAPVMIQEIKSRVKDMAKTTRAKLHLNVQLTVS